MAIFLPLAYLEVWLGCGVGKGWVEGRGEREEVGDLAGGVKGRERLELLKFRNCKPHGTEILISEEDVLLNLISDWLHNSLNENMLKGLKMPF